MPDFEPHGEYGFKLDCRIVKIKASGIINQEAIKNHSKHHFSSVYRSADCARRRVCPGANATATRLSKPWLEARIVEARKTAVHD